MPGCRATSAGCSAFPAGGRRVLGSRGCRVLLVVNGLKRLAGRRDGPSGLEFFASGPKAAVFDEPRSLDVCVVERQHESMSTT